MVKTSGGSSSGRWGRRVQAAEKLRDRPGRCRLDADLEQPLGTGRKHPERRFQKKRLGSLREHLRPRAVPSILPIPQSFFPAVVVVVIALRVDEKKPAQRPGLSRPSVESVAQTHVEVEAIRGACARVARNRDWKANEVFSDARGKRLFDQLRRAPAETPG